MTFLDELFCHRLSILSDMLFHLELECDCRVAGPVAECVRKLVKAITSFEPRIYNFKIRAVKFKQGFHCHG